MTEIPNPLQPPPVPPAGGAAPIGPVSGIPAATAVDASGFYRTARTLGRSPLGIITMFIVLVYSVAGIVAATGSGDLPPLLLKFIVWFPVLVLGVFTFLLIYHHHKLYAPDDFSDQRNWMRLQPGLVDLQETVLTLQDAAARGGLLPEQLNAVAKLDQFLKDVADRTGMSLVTPIEQKAAGPPGGRMQYVETKMEGVRAMEERRSEKRETFKKRKDAADPEDPNKGEFGGHAKRNDWTLDLVGNRVRRLARSDWFQFELRVRNEKQGAAAKGYVEFHLHHSFAQPKQRVKMVNGEAVLSVVAYGSFTVGAVMPDGKTELELDLADPSIFSPTTFKER